MDPKVSNSLHKNNIFDNLGSMLIKSKIVKVEDTTEFPVKTRKIITLSADEFQELINDPNVWMNATDREALLQGNISYIEVGVDPGYPSTMLDYIGGIEQITPCFYDEKGPLIPTATDVTVTVFCPEELGDLGMRHPAIRKYVTEHGYAGTHDTQPTVDAPAFQFNFPEKIMHTYFDTSYYHPEVFIDEYKDPCTVLVADVPYAYYAYMPLSPDVYTWSEEKQAHEFIHYTVEKFTELWDYVCKNGITEPITFMTHGDILVPRGAEGTLLMFIAKMLHIPSVPAMVIVTDEHEWDNKFIVDIIENTPQLEEKAHKSTNLMRGIFAPNILFAGEQDPNSPTIDINGVSYRQEQYTEKTRCGHCRVMCLNPDADISALTESEKKITQAVKEMQANAAALLNSDIERAKKALEGE